jgi:multimeric flavodoxin WrbA
MKIMAIMGSPRHKGDTNFVVDRFITGAESAGHTVKKIHVANLNFKGCSGCMACSEKKVEICVHNDDFTALVPEIRDTDCLLISTPIYFGHMTGNLKNFMDRFYTFCLEDFKIRDLQGKKYITVVSSGAPVEVFCQPVTEFFKTWFGEFFKLESVGHLMVGDLMGPGEITKKLAILNQAELMGKEL